MRRAPFVLGVFLFWSWFLPSAVAQVPLEIERQCERGAGEFPGLRRLRNAA